jgi:TRL-like protein family
MKHPKTFFIAVALGLSAFLLGGCGLLYTNIRVPYSYNAATPSDVHADKEDPTAIGRSCNQTVIYLVAWGNAGYAAAVQKALEPYPKATLYDVKTDVKVESYVIGLYTRTCTIVTGRVSKP